jgi:hypothetical protein
MQEQLIDDAVRYWERFRGSWPVIGDPVDNA